MVLRRVEDTSSKEDITDEENVHVQTSEPNSPMNAFKNAVRLFMTREMLLLSVAFFYTGEMTVQYLCEEWKFNCNSPYSDIIAGLELSFFSGVYSPSIGFTLSIGESAKQLVGLSGICIGLGEVIGGAGFGLAGSKTTRWGRDPIFITGFVLHLISFFLIYINLPNAAPFGDTTDISYMSPPRASIALICSFLLGFGDACFNTQIYSMLGGVFAKNSAAAFSIFKFTQVSYLHSLCPPLVWNNHYFLYPTSR